MRLFVDLEKCSSCKECVVCCGYFYHPQNNGITSLREFATFSLVCRQCQEACCVNSCYHNALEKQPDGILRRSTILCTSCKSCTLACPFGVIMPEFIPYLDSKCDFCIGETKELPLCVKSCPYQAVEVKEVDEDPEKNIYFIGKSLAVHSRRWLKDDLILKKK